MTPSTRTKTGNDRVEKAPLHLLEHLAVVEEEMAQKSHWELFCDFDGVLSPLTLRPSDARIDPAIKAQLQALSKSIPIGIISGRSLDDVRDRVAIPALTYAGDHGLEIAGPDVQWEQTVDPHILLNLTHLATKLENIMRPYDGVLIERKDLGIALHTRLADPEQKTVIASLLLATVTEVNQDAALRVTHGKEVFEVRPNTAWDKGHAIRWILRQRYGETWERDALPFYLGDDETDEDAFNALSGGITVRVGSESGAKTHARFQLGAMRDVETFLSWLLSMIPPLL